MEIKKAGDRIRRVLVVDTEPDTRLCVKEILKSANDFKLAGDFSNAEEALRDVPRLKPNLVLLGVRLPSFKNFEYIRRFKRIIIGLKIIVVTGVANTDLLESSLQAGAEFCLVKPLTASQCLATMWFAGCQQTEREPESSQPDLGFSSGAIPGNSLPLSQRESEVLSGLAEGLLYKEIADNLGISYSAVHKYQHNLFAKLQVSNRSEAIRLWLDTTMGAGNSLRRDPG